MKLQFIKMGFVSVFSFISLSSMIAYENIMIYEGVFYFASGGGRCVKLP